MTDRWSAPPGVMSASSTFSSPMSWSSTPPPVSGFAPAFESASSSEGGGPALIDL